jgi:hypothetical protein
MQQVETIMKMLTKFGYRHEDEITSYERETLKQSGGRLRHASWHFPLSRFAPALMALEPNSDLKTQSVGGKTFKNPLRMNMQYISATKRMHQAQNTLYPDLYTSSNGKLVLKASKVVSKARSLCDNKDVLDFLSTVDPSSDAEAMVGSDDESEDEDESSPLQRKLIASVRAANTSSNTLENIFGDDGGDGDEADTESESYASQEDMESTDEIGRLEYEDINMSSSMESLSYSCHGTNIDDTAMTSTEDNVEYSTKPVLTFLSDKYVHHHFMYYFYILHLGV